MPPCFVCPGLGCRAARIATNRTHVAGPTFDRTRRGHHMGLAGEEATSRVPLPKVQSRDALKGQEVPPLQSAQPMPSHCLPAGKCQLQWHL